MQATLTFLGTGTSMGVPTLGCDCAVCVSAVASSPGLPAPSPHNRRTRPSVLVRWEGHNVVIDTGPDFHAQAIAAGIHRLDAVLYTHGHADHVLGMDDLRPLSFHNSPSLPLYADEQTALTIERIFNYTFSSDHQYPTRARVALHRIPTTPGAEVELFGVQFLRVPVTHGRQTITGFRFGSAAYLTDLSDLHPESLPLLADLDILILDALRREPHPTHSHLEKSIALVEQLAPRRAFFTHISHGLDHDATNATLPPHMRLAYDGLQLAFEIGPEAA
jgi:phosphoribosyl 1,2-cyclic phosphate phosphodiesterase